MERESNQFVIGDTVAASLEEKRPPRRRWFRRKRKEAPPPLTSCENCGTELRGSYCYQCGQAAVDYHRSFRHVIVDVLDSFLNWDSKFIRTIGLLLWSPGWLTKQFLEGKRVRYLHPLRVYLLVSIVFFLCARLVPVTDARDGKSSTQLTPEARAELTKLLPTLSPEARAKLDQRLADDAAINERPVVVFDTGDDPPKPSAHATPSPSPGTESPSSPGAPPDSAVTASSPEEESGVLFGPDKHRPRTWWEKRIKDRIGEHGAKLKLFVETLRSNLSTTMLFCVPFFAFVLKLLYLRKKRFYIEHLVYALHVHAFFYLSVIFVVLISIGLARWIPGTPQVLLTLLLCILVVAHILVSIRRVYRQGWFMTIFKFLFGGAIYFFVIAVAIGATAFVTLLLPD